MASSQSIKLEVDDTQPLICIFQTTENEDDHVVYLIKVQRGFDSKYQWQIKKRYSDFDNLYAQLKISNYDLPLPPKKAFGNTKREFLSVRQLGLQEFMDKILGNLFLANSLVVKKFLDQENYLENFREVALAHVTMLFRSEANWQVVEPLNEIGWRFRKKHILLKNTDSPNNKYLLTWCEHGIDKTLKEVDLKTIFQQFTQIQHEYIEPILRINSGESSTIIIQKFNDKLISLRDYINGNTKINSNYLKKYSLQKTYQTLPIHLIKQIGKKILLALQFIYSKGLFYGHLHTGNILIEQNGNYVKLTDITNGLLGLPYFYRSYVLEYRKIQNIELVDVYGFGHVLYEMTYGAPLVTVGSKIDFNDCPDREIKQLLDILLVDDVLQKSGLPTINQLLEMPFFANTIVDVLPTSSVSAAALTTTASNSNSKLFTSAKVKELLIKAREAVEKRLNEEQKFIYKFRRQSQAEAKVLSEEEIRKRRKEKKKAERDSTNSLEFPTPPTSPLSITTSSSSSKLKNGSLSSSIKSDSFSDRTDNLSVPGSPPPTPISPPPTPFSNSAQSMNTNSKKSTGGPPAPPPPPPPPPAPSLAPPPPPPAPSAPMPPPPAGSDRSDLLSSITGFSKAKLKKAKTVDKSAPKI